jgi:hypothetical protein
MQFTPIVRPGTHRNTFKQTCQLFKDGLIPALAQAFGITPALLPVCFRRWHKFAYEYLQFHMMHDDHRYNWPVIVNCDNDVFVPIVRPRHLFLLAALYDHKTCRMIMHYHIPYFLMTILGLVGRIMKSFGLQ